MSAGKFLFLATFFLVAYAKTDGKPPENPVAVQFRQHLADADQNKDAFVTRNELVAEISKDPARDPAGVEQIVTAMMADLDADHDDKLSETEIAEGARRAGENAVTKQDVQRAQQLVDGLNDYKNNHNGKQPADLKELATFHLVPKSALRCILVDGQEKPWGYQPASYANAVMIFSPGPTNSDGQYIIALGDGRVLGVQDNEFDLKSVLQRNLHVYPGK